MRAQSSAGRVEWEAFSLRSRRLLRNGLVLSQMPYLEGGTFLRPVLSCSCTVTWVSNPMTCTADWYGGISVVSLSDQEPPDCEHECVTSANCRIPSLAWRVEPCRRVAGKARLSGFARAVHKAKRLDLGIYPENGGIVGLQLDPFTSTLSGGSCTPQTGEISS